MVINDRSGIGEILQALAGTWDVSTDNDWKCIELGKFRLFKKLVNISSPLPEKFIDSRQEITPFIIFHKDTIEGGIITLQDTAITAQGLVLIIQF